MSEIAWITQERVMVVPAERPLREILDRLPAGVDWVVLRREVPEQAQPLCYVWHCKELKSAAERAGARDREPAVDVLGLREWGQSAIARDDARPRDASELPPVSPLPSSSRFVAMDARGRITAVGVEPVPVPRMAPADPEGTSPPPPRPRTRGGIGDLLGGFRGGDRDEERPPVRTRGGLDFEPPAPTPPGRAEAVLSAQAPEQIAVGADEIVDVRVELREGAVPLAHATTATIDVDSDERAAEEIRAILSVGDATLEITGPRVVKLRPPTPGAPAKGMFEVRGVAAGPARIEVMFRQGSTDLGTISFTLQVVAARTSTRTVRVEEQADPADRQEGVPDLTVLIQQRQSGDAVRYSYLVESDLLGLNFAEFESRAFQKTGDGTAAPLAYVLGVYERIVGRALVNMGDVRAFARELAAIGADLCRQLLDDDFVRALWPVRDRVQAVHVTSWEPYIPWELLRLTHPDTDETDDRFLGEYGLVRSLSGGKHARRLALRDWAYLAGTYPEGSWPAVGGEVEYLTTDLPARSIQPTRLPSDYEDMLDALAAAEFDVLHIACHGEADHTRIDQSHLVLGDRRTPAGVVSVELHPATVRHAAKLKQRRPLVFLNACESGRAGGSLTDLGGWPKAFLDAGAGAFVGTSWSVREKPAVTFARAFYDALLAGCTLAEAARRARAAAKALGDGSWLAFVVYGESSARLER